MKIRFEFSTAKFASCKILVIPPCHNKEKALNKQTEQLTVSVFFPIASTNAERLLHDLLRHWRTISMTRRQYHCLFTTSLQSTASGVVITYPGRHLVVSRGNIHYCWERCFVNNETFIGTSCSFNTCYAISCRYCSSSTAGRQMSFWLSVYDGADRRDWHLVVVSLRQCWPF